MTDADAGQVKSDGAAARRGYFGDLAGSVVENAEDVRGQIEGAETPRTADHTEPEF